MGWVMVVRGMACAATRNFHRTRAGQLVANTTAGRRVAEPNEKDAPKARPEEKRDGPS